MARPTSAKFATYNILNPYFAVKWAEQAGLNEAGKLLSREELKASTMASDENAWRQYSNWDERAPEISKNLKFADIVCLQEISKETIKQLQLFSGYRLAKPAYHASNHPIQEYGNAILYNGEKVRLIKDFEIKHGTRESSRSAACGVFEIDGKMIKVASVHLEGYYTGENDLEKKQHSKVSGFNELQTYLNALQFELEGMDGIFIAGDFNEDPSEEMFDLYRPGFLKKQGFHFDGNLEVTEPSKGRRIDWACYKPLTSKETIKLRSMGLERIQKKASDHLMTGTFIEFDG